MAAFTFMLYLLAVLTCLVCTVLLFRGYRASGARLLLWSAICFVFLTLNNLLLFFDLPVFTQIDLRPYRLATAFVGLLFLLYAFLFETE
jgi:hypothetical protein